MNQTPTFNFNNFNTKPDIITCVIEDGTIQKIDYTSNTRVVIGVLKETYNELVEENEKHIEMLYEHNILTKPKTQEDINKELLEQNNQMALLIKEMRDEMKLIKEVKNNESPSNYTDVIDVVSE